MKYYTLYFYSQSGSCIFYFSIDGKSKAKVVKMGREIAAILETYYKDNDRGPWIKRVTVEVEQDNKPAD